MTIFNIFLLLFYLYYNYSSIVVIREFYYLFLTFNAFYDDDLENTFLMFTNIEKEDV